MFDVEAEAAGTTLELRSNSNGTVVPIRLTFGRGAGQVVYEYMPFTVTRVGSKEIALLSNATEPFAIEAEIREKGGKLSFTEKTLNYSVRSGHKWVSALTALRSEGYLSNV